MDLNAEDIAELYKNRWSVELFFKWLKQHLHIKEFYGTSENAVNIQIYSAIIAYCLVAIVASELKLEMSTYDFLRIVGVSLFDKTPLRELLNNEHEEHVNEKTNSYGWSSRTEPTIKVSLRKMLTDFRGH